ncbi:tunicamycin resistance protein, partial [Klebsiella pneumoniae]
AGERLPCTTRVPDSGAHTSEELAAMVLDGNDGRT